MVHMEQVAFSYGKKDLMKDLSLTLQDGNIYGLLGRNGAGKTTLLHLMSGQLFPQSGRIEVFGFDAGRREGGMLEQICYVPEEFPLPDLTVEQYLEMLTPFYPRYDDKQFWRFFDVYGLERSNTLRTLSLGQKKKCYLAFALASNTPLLLLDEPTNGLDIPSKKQFRQTLAQAMTEDRIIVISTHQVRDVENLIDPILILDDGAIVFEDSIDAVNERFTVVRNAEKQEECIYSEQDLAGWTSILPRKEGDAMTNMDLELLFNAVAECPGAFGRGGVR